jgi:hypothetical protein
MKATKQVVRRLQQSEKKQEGDDREVPLSTRTSCGLFSKLKLPKVKHYKKLWQLVRNGVDSV